MHVLTSAIVEHYFPDVSLPMKKTNINLSLNFYVQYCSIMPSLISSHSAGMDYLPVNQALLFTSESDLIRCFDVHVINDRLVEKKEKTFTLSLSTSSHQLLVNGTASVKIMDSKPQG